MTALFFVAVIYTLTLDSSNHSHPSGQNFKVSDTFLITCSIFNSVSFGKMPKKRYFVFLKEARTSFGVDLTTRNRWDLFYSFIKESKPNKYFI